MGIFTVRCSIGSDPWCPFFRENPLSLRLPKVEGKQAGISQQPGEKRRHMEPQRAGRALLGGGGCHEIDKLMLGCSFQLIRISFRDISLLKQDKIPGVGVLWTKFCTSWWVSWGLIHSDAKWILRNSRYYVTSVSSGY